jgi:hypothetical protein
MDILASLFHRHGLQGPDGRPLCLYQLTDQEFEQLAVKLYVYRPTHGPVTRPEAVAFCLFGAEAWRRGYDGGEWAWQVILGAHGLGHLREFTSLLVERGLRELKRPGLRLERREFLGAIAREAGLPPSVLAREGSRLREFLRMLIDDMASFQGVAVDTLARQHRHRLPQRLRDDEFLGLMGEVASAARQLAHELGKTRATIAALDSAVPGWRERIPLRLDDEGALALIEGLVVTVQEGPAPRPLRVLTHLTHRADGLRLLRSLDLPTRIPQATVASWVGLEACPPRIELLLQTDRGPRTLAYLALDNAFYMTDIVGSLDLGAASTESHIELALRARGTMLGRFMPAGGDALGEFPWIFVPVPDDAKRFRLTTSPRFVPGMRVALPEGWTTDGGANIGEVLSRRLVEPTGPVTLSCGEDMLAIRAHLTDALDATYDWVGPTLPQAPEVFVGFPRLRRTLPTGEARNVDAQRIEVARGGRWRRAIDVTPEGHEVVRFVENGVPVAQARIRVIPAVAKIEFRPESEHIAQVTLRDWGTNQIAPGGEGVTVMDGGAAGAAWNGRIQAASANEATFDLRVRWPSGRELTLKLPFPRQGMRWARLSGETIPQDGVVALSEIWNVMGEAWPKNGGANRTFSIEARLSADDVTTARMPIGTLSRGAGGHRCMLVGLERTIERMLALSATPQASVTLVMTDEFGAVNGESPRLVVRRFELELQRDVNARLVRGPLQEDLEVIAIRIDAPRERLTLPRPELGAWSVDGLGPGPWLILGRTRERVVTRPLLWHIPRWSAMDETTTAEGETRPPENAAQMPTTNPLARATNMPKYAHREAAFAEVLSTMGQASDHIGWRLMEDYLATLDELPASTFEAVRALTKAPSALAVALMRDRDPQRLIRAMESLPFSWASVSVEAFFSGVESAARSLQSAGLDDKLLRTVVGERLDTIERALLARHKGLRATFAFVRQRLLATGIPQGSAWQEIQFLGNQPEFVAAQLYTDFNAARQRHENEEWPRFGLVGLAERLPRRGVLSEFEARQPEEAHEVVIAPLLSALAAVDGVALSALESFALRQAEAFDPTWFTEAHTFALAWAIGARMTGGH